MRLILVRHGRTPSNTAFLLDTAAPGADLDEVGCGQADSLVERLSEEAVAAVFASNLVRTQQTAGPLARERELPITVLPGLREIGAGDDEMSSDSSRYIATLTAWGSGEPGARIPGGEDAHEFLGRFDEAIATVVASASGSALVVSHGAALRVWSYARVEGFPEAITSSHLDNTGVIVVEGSPAEGWALIRLEGLRAAG